MTDPSPKHIRPGFYRHFKGGEYEVLDIAIHSETNELMVVYRCLYGDFALWVRPLDMFLATVDIDGKTTPRFQFVRDSEKNNER